jgi:hypothetical protein
MLDQFVSDRNGFRMKVLGVPPSRIHVHVWIQTAHPEVMACPCGTLFVRGGGEEEDGHWGTGWATGEHR